MARSCGLMFWAMVVTVALIGGAFAQTTHVVLDNAGWTIPQAGAAAYTNWAASKTFMVGDTLVFNFATGLHDVAQVRRAAFDACTTTNTTGQPITSGPANITLNTAGEHYYICTFGQHCASGQKLAINVTGSPTTPPRSAPAPTGVPPVPSSPAPTSVPPTGGPSSAVPTTPNSASVAVTANMVLVGASLSVILLSLGATSIL